MKAESINTNAIGATVLCYLLGRIHITRRKFHFGYSFSTANCDIRSWDHDMRNSYNVMRLMPNSVIFIEVKKWTKPWKTGSERRSTGCRSTNTDDSPAPHTIQGPQPDPSKEKWWKTLGLSSCAHCVLHLHVHSLQNPLLTLLSINQHQKPCWLHLSLEYGHFWPNPASALSKKPKTRSCSIMLHIPLCCHCF